MQLLIVSAFSFWAVKDLETQTGMRILVVKIKWVYVYYWGGKII